LDSRPATRLLDRRQFARAASSGIALFAIPGWFAACARTRATVTTKGPEPSESRPQLVLHVPDDKGGRRRLGQLFGIFLVRGEPAELAPLATCELACATTAELADRGEDLSAVKALLKTPEHGAVAALSGEFPFEGPVEWETDPYGLAFAESVRKNLAWMAAQLARALGPGSAAFEDGLARERAAGLGFDASETPSAERASSAPCHALAAAAANPATREAWNLELTNFAVNRWFDAAPRGSSWATNRGCVEVIESRRRDEQLSTKCGMGHVPPIAQRFLHLFSAEELAGG
jgi:hypothetical protein